MKSRLLILSAVFLVTILFVYRPQEDVVQSKAPLKQFLSAIPDYKVIRHIKLEQNAYDMLDLDDYFYADYQGPSGKVNLYVGYYYTSNKAYAAHSPLICYPSQGWVIDEQQPSTSMNVGPYSIKFDEITTSQGKIKELVIFWLQAYERTNTQIVMNKIDMGYNKLMNNGEQHGFVRVSVSLTNTTYKEAKQSAVDFIAAFYPHLIEYVGAE